MKSWLWLRGPKRLWTRPCRREACQFGTEGEWHNAHLTRLSSWALAR